MKILKIGAEWCPGCIVMKPRWKKIEEEHTWLETQYLDFDNDTEEVKKYLEEDENLPAFIFLDNQQNELLRLHGEIEEEKLVEVIYQYKDQ